MEINWYNILTITGGLVLPVVIGLFKLFSDVKSHGSIIPEIKANQAQCEIDHQKINTDLTRLQAEEKYLRRDVEILQNDMKEGFNKTNDLQNEILRYLKNN